MFLFIGVRSGRLAGHSFIQIHLMFLFITSQFSIAEIVAVNSNTSHVLIYLPLPFKEKDSRIIQIHLMFLFIPSSMPLYSSIVRDSNTSHVLIYLYGARGYAGPR